MFVTMQGEFSPEMQVEFDMLRREADLGSSHHVRLLD